MDDGDEEDDLEVDCDADEDDHDVEEEDGDDFEEEDEEEDEEHLSEADLRRAWDDARDAVRLLERSNKRVPQELLAQAREQRHAAEGRWRAAKTPQPLAKRLRWAEAALTEAVAKQDDHRREFEEFEQQAECRRRELLQRAEVDAARTARKREALDALRGEGARPALPACESAVRVAATGICTDLGPALAAVADKVPEGTPLWTDIQAALATLCNVEGVLRQAIDRQAQQDQLRQPLQRQQQQHDQQQRQQQQQQPTVFDISGGVTCGDGSAAEQVRGVAACASAEAKGPRGAAASSTTAAGSQHGGAGAAPRWAKQAGKGQTWGASAWEKKGALEPGGPADADARGGDGAQPSAEAAAEARRALQQHQQQAAAEEEARAAADAERQRQLTAIKQQQQEEALRLKHEAERAAAAAAAEEERQRQELLAKTSPEERQRMATLHAQQAAIQAAGFGTQQAMQGAGLVHQAHAHQLAVGATARGVDPDADKLMAMSTEQLADWDREQQAHGAGLGACPW